LSPGGNKIGDAALPFYIWQGEGEAMRGEARRTEKLVAGAKALHLRGAEVRAVGEVENVGRHGVGFKKCAALWQ
jgi:hypothetical protein